MANELRFYSILSTIILCSGMTIYGQQAAFFELLSASTPQEKRLQSLLSDVRNAYSQLPQEEHPTARMYLKGKFLSEHTKELAEIKELDEVVRKQQYPREVEAMDALLKTGHVSVNAVDAEGNPALYLAVLNNKPKEMFDVLFKHGANIYATNKQGQTAEGLAHSLCDIDQALNIQTQTGIDRKRTSCWALDALATERRIAAGGLRGIYGRLTKGVKTASESLLRHW